MMDDKWFRNGVMVAKYRTMKQKRQWGKLIPVWIVSLVCLFFWLGLAALLLVWLP